MKVRILGAGPAGLYTAYLFKKWMGVDTEVEVLEQNANNSTFGFGVVFSDAALKHIAEDDRDTHDAIVSGMERWKDLTISVNGEDIRIDGIGFTSIGRLELLLLLQERARSVGVSLEFERTVTSVEEVRAGADLVVAADGVNSLIRAAFEDSFGTQVHIHPNKFLWYGTSKPYPTLTQTFRSNNDGEFTAHHYRYRPDRSTFLVETNHDTWHRAGFSDLDEDETQRYFENLFGPELDGHPIIRNNSYWRNFPKVSQDTWFHENMVLIGDALHTAHFSIGSGTRLAMEDSIALVKAVLERSHDIPGALAEFQNKRKPQVDKIVSAANTSLDWYTTFGERMKQDPYDFAYSYIQRSGRISEDRLISMAPEFMSRYRDHKAAKIDQPKGVS